MHSWISSCTVFSLVLFAGDVEYQVEASPELIDSALTMGRRTAPPFPGELGRDGPANDAQLSTGGEPDRRNGKKRVETLLDFAEAHGVRVQLEVRRATGDAGSLIDATLTGSYKGIRAWLLDVCKSSPELLVTSAHFRRGPTDGDARAEMVFDYSRE